MDSLKRLRELRKTPTWVILKWALMSATVFWTLIYRLGAEASIFPEFVYVNF
jgi:hypothetical protein